MRAVQITRYGDVDALQIRQIDRPAPRAGEVLVRIRAAAANPFDNKIRMGWLQRFYPIALPATTGGDYAGEIEEVGAAVTTLAVGDRVFGLLTPMQGGSFADYVSVDASLVRKAPSNVGFEDAAALPLAAQTALFGLKTLADVQPGHRVLVHGAGGGVGGMAVQAAKAMGAHVVATCSGEKAAMVKALGADAVIDYGAADFATETGDIDVAFDVIGGDVNRRTYGVMKPGGVMLVVLREDPAEMASRAELSAKHQVSVKVIAFENEPDLLDVVRPWVEAGLVKANVTAVLPLEDAARAQTMIAGGHTAGKIVLKVY